MHSSRDTISVLRVRDLKHPFKECVFTADFGSWKDLGAECFSFYGRSYIITSQAPQTSIMFETGGLLSVSRASTISRKNNILQEEFSFFSLIIQSSFTPGSSK